MASEPARVETKNVVEQKLRASQAFVQELLGRSFPLETSAEVLDYLVQESGRFHDSLDLQNSLSAARQQQINVLETEVHSLQLLLEQCGIDHKEHKFDALQMATLFCDATILPSISNCLLGFLQESKDLLDQEEAYTLLTQHVTGIELTQEAIASKTRDISVETLRRLQADARTHAIATADLKARHIKDRAETGRARVPELNVSFVAAQQQTLDILSRDLAEREEVLNSLNNLPLNIEEVLLENDRMHRHLERLDQQRRDLFRSIRAK